MDIPLDLRAQPRRALAAGDCTTGSDREASIRWLTFNQLQSTTPAD